MEEKEKPKYYWDLILNHILIKFFLWIFKVGLKFGMLPLIWYLNSLIVGKLRPADTWEEKSSLSYSLVITEGIIVFMVLLWLDEMKEGFISIKKNFLEVKETYKKP